MTPAPPPSKITNTSSTQERDSLYKALDDKDDEINKQSQTIERLKNELEDEKQVPTRYRVACSSIITYFP